MKTTVNGHQLKEMIRDKVARGLLPRAPLPKTGGALGRGEPCSGCGQPVTDREPVVEGTVSDLNGEQIIQFHIECYYLWVEANRKRGTLA